MEAAPVLVMLSLVITDFWIVAFAFYFTTSSTLERLISKILEITTLPNLNLEFYTEEPKKIMAAFKSKNE